MLTQDQDTLNEWRQKHSLAEPTEQDHELNQHYPTEPVQDGEVACRPRDAEPVLSFNNGNFYYAIKGQSGTYALLRRPVDRVDREERALLGGMAGLLTGIPWLFILDSYTGIVETAEAGHPGAMAFALLTTFGLLPLIGAIIACHIRTEPDVGEPELITTFESLLDEDQTRAALLDAVGPGENEMDVRLYGPGREAVEQARSELSVIE